MNKRLPRRPRAGLEEIIATREAELEVTIDAARFWRMAADAARSRPGAYKTLSQHAKTVAVQAEQLGRELAELQGEEWIEEEQEEQLETAGI